MWVQIPAFGCPFCSKVVVHGHCLVTLPFTIFNETNLEMGLIVATGDFALRII